MQKLISSFRACLVQAIAEHRGTDAGLVAAFESRVRDHQRRYHAKIDCLRAGDSREATTAELDAIESTIDRWVETEIASVRAAGRVEFSIWGPAFTPAP